MELKPLIAAGVLYNQQFEIDSLVFRIKGKHLGNHRPSVS
jgi:hypothetical protein